MNKDDSKLFKSLREEEGGGGVENRYDRPLPVAGGGRHPGGGPYPTGKKREKSHTMCF